MPLPTLNEAMDYSAKLKQQNKRSITLVAVLSVLCIGLVLCCVLLLQSVKGTKADLNDCRQHLASAEQQLQLDYTALDYCAHQLETADTYIELLQKPENEMSFLETQIVSGINGSDFFQNFDTYVQNTIQQSGWQYSLNRYNATKEGAAP